MLVEYKYILYLYFKVMDSEHNIVLDLFSQSKRIHVTQGLVNFLLENESMDFKINV